MANTIEHWYGRANNFPKEMLSEPRKGCTLNTLERLAALQPGNHDPEFRCNYYLGEKLFNQLQETMPEAAFRDAANRLYELGMELDAENEDAGIAEVTAAFPQHEAVVNQHWGGSGSARTARVTPTDGRETAPRTVQRPAATPAMTPERATPTPSLPRSLMRPSSLEVPSGLNTPTAPHTEPQPRRCGQRRKARRPWTRD